MRKTAFALAALFLFVTAAAAGDALPNRLGNAKVGEWVLMQDVTPDGAIEKTKISVISVKDGVIAVRREHYGPDGAVEETKEHELNIERYAGRMEDIAARAKAIGKETLVINDKEYAVTTVEFESRKPGPDGNPREFKFWLTDELPIGGLAKMWSSDVDIPSAEVVDFGF